MHHHQIGGHFVDRGPDAGRGSVAIVHPGSLEAVGGDIEIFGDGHPQGNRGLVVGTIVARPPDPRAEGLGKCVDDRCSLIGIPIDAGRADEPAAPGMTAVCHLETNAVAGCKGPNEGDCESVVAMLVSEVGRCVIGIAFVGQLEDREHTEAEIGIERYLAQPALDGGEIHRHAARQDLGRGIDEEIEFVVGDIDGRRRFLRRPVLPLALLALPLGLVRRAFARPLFELEPDDGRWFEDPVGSVHGRRRGDRRSSNTKTQNER